MTNLPYTTTQLRVSFNQLPGGHLMITFPKNCCPYGPQLTVVIKEDKDVTELIAHLNEWLQETPLTVDTFGVYTQVIVAIGRYWVG